MLKMNLSLFAQKKVVVQLPMVVIHNLNVLAQKLLTDKLCLADQFFIVNAVLKFTQVKTLAVVEMIHFSLKSKAL